MLKWREEEATKLECMWEFNDIISERRVDARAIGTCVKDTPGTHSLPWEKECEFQKNAKHAIQFAQKFLGLI